MRKVRAVLGRAVRWYRVARLRRAACQGDVEAQVELGHVYEDEDLGVEPDYDEAESWCRVAQWQRAADEGDAYAQLELGDAWLVMSTAEGYVRVAEWYRGADKHPSLLISKKHAPRC